MIGTYSGAAFVDITNPICPIYIGKLPRVSGTKRTTIIELKENTGTWTMVETTSTMVKPIPGIMYSTRR
jgi:hypothetical protein